MKALVGSIEVEGTPAEIADFVRAMGSLPIAASAAVYDKPPKERHFVDEKIAFLALKRRPLSSEQKTILRVLRDNHPNWTLATELRRATSYNSNQLAGLFGAFGKRIASTAGYIEGSWFFDQEWDYDHDCHGYRLPESVLVAVKRAAI